MKTFIPSLLLLLIGLTNYAQTAVGPKLYSVRADAPQNDEKFSKLFNELLAAYSSDYRGIEMQFKNVDDVDSVFALKEKLVGSDGATVTKNPINITLSARFVFGSDMMGMFKLLQKIKAALPDDFAYTKSTNTASGISDYRFFKRADSKTPHPGFPEEIRFSGDSQSAYITLVKAK